MGFQFRFYLFIAPVDGGLSSDYVKCSMDDGVVLLWCIDDVTNLDFNLKHICLLLSNQTPLYNIPEHILLSY